MPVPIETIVATAGMIAATVEKHPELKARLQTIMLDPALNETAKIEAVKQLVREDPSAAAAEVRKVAPAGALRAVSDAERAKEAQEETDA
tara:strand:- start:40 stop:309 length:270 start_codon:yes stop_codon:yes gene_type:complete